MKFVFTISAIMSMVMAGVSMLINDDTQEATFYAVFAFGFYALAKDT